MTIIDQHIDPFNRATLKQLMDLQPTRASLSAESSIPPLIVSLYMPTERKGRETQQQPIRLKNLLRVAEEQLKTFSLPPKQIEQMLAPAQPLLDDAQSWQLQNDGLALFLLADQLFRYRLPMAFREQVVVGANLYCKPLLPLLGNDASFYLLTLNQKGVHLYQGSRFALNEVSLPEDTPTSMEEELQYDDFEKQIQHHGGGGRSTSTGRPGAMFFGHADAGDDAILKEQLVRFFRHLDNGVRKSIQEGKGVPLLLAGIEYLQGAYRQANQYHDLVAVNIEKEPESLGLPELHRQAWELLEPTFQSTRQRDWDAWQHLAGTKDARSGKTIEEIVPAAFYQRVETLFLPEDRQLWGTFSPTDSTLVRHNEYAPGLDDLYDFSAIHTLLNGGSVYLMPAEQMPHDPPIAATFRY